MTAKCSKTRVPAKFKPLSEIPFCTYRKYRPEYFEAPTLLDICARVYSARPDPPYSSYNAEEIADLILKDTGHPEYKEAFLKNEIDGKSIIFLEADKFPRIGIRQFHIIKELTAKIRNLCKDDEFKRNISLPVTKPEALYLNHWNRVPSFMPWCPHIIIGSNRKVNPMTGTTQRQIVSKGPRICKSEESPALT